MKTADASYLRGRTGRWKTPVERTTMGTHYVSESGLRDFLEALAKDCEVYGTLEREERVDFEALDSENAALVTLRTARCYASPKSLLFPVCEKVAAYSMTGPGEAAIEQPTRAIVGLRQCDISAIQALDKVFLEGDFVDPFYAARRESTRLLSTDCIEAADSCFCTMVDGKPYPTEGYDVNFSPLADGCIAETGSEKGEELIQKYPQLFTYPSEEQLKEREENREAITEKVQEQNREFQLDRPIQDVLDGEIDEKTWQRLAWDCVECGACTNICPSCHCFLMYDRPAEVKDEFERLRTWDSCVFGEYHRMAGAGGMKPNPKPEIRTRFGNRFYHKFLWFHNMFSRFACVGCGRCFDACLGEIDVRKVLSEIAKKKK